MRFDGVREHSAFVEVTWDELMWDYRTGTLRFTNWKSTNPQFSRQSHSRSRSGRDNVIITASWDTTVGILSGDSLKMKGCFRGHDKGVLCCSYGWRLRIGGDGDTVRVWDPTTAEEISTFKETGGCDVSSDDRVLCTNVCNSYWSVWDCRSGHRVRKTQWRGSGACRISPCGGRVSVCGYCACGVFSVSDGNQILRIKEHDLYDTEWISPSRLLLTGEDTALFDITSSRSYSVGQGAYRVATAPGVALGVHGDSLYVWKLTGIDHTEYYCRFARVQECIHNVGE